MHHTQDTLVDTTGCTQPEYTRRNAARRRWKVTQRTCDRDAAIYRDAAMACNDGRIVHARIRRRRRQEPARRIAFPSHRQDGWLQHGGDDPELQASTNLAASEE